ncbi:MAG: dihydropteroate synthase [Desulfobacterales bacterium]|nr:MAG: dihydropteroate synthase [Desulfobacterales bacterium]
MSLPPVSRPVRSLPAGRHHLDLGRRTLIMGVLNITPDSFSDGGRYLSPAAARDHALRLVAEGADILDIGGESTRPFSEGVSESVELQRIIPVIEELVPDLPVPISIDTSKAEVARQAVEAGAAIINDVTALRHDPEMAHLAAETGAPVVLMHMKGAPRTMQESPEYRDAPADIIDFLRNIAARARDAGIRPDRIILDPGIGFGKTVRHNLELIARLDELAALGYPVLVGTSRKAFIRRILTADGGSEPAPDSAAAGRGTLATVCAAALNGADIVRVHDVAAARECLDVLDAIAAAGS